ncbi:unnamed protein product [Dibothriocephalus latus]|uniref:Uncharacterized protein n=1 Tax=Dibothriocephalus latus TaxID=60516 RepID=A0A3P7L3S3_DIBLA|nr:unnamed protein product [Dibothriocephalus latus]
MAYRDMNNAGLFRSTDEQLDWQTYVLDSCHLDAKRRKLPELENIRWLKRAYLPAPLGAPGSRQEPMDAKFSRAQMRPERKLLSTFIAAMEELGFSDRWMLHAGTLLGSF